MLLSTSFPFASFRATKRLLFRRGLFLLSLGGFLFESSSLFAWNALVTGGRCTQSRRSCRSTIGNAGGAGACCDPQSPNSTGPYSTVAECSKQNACVGGKPYVWSAADRPLPWNFFPNKLPGTFKNHPEADYEAAVQAAFSAWSAPACTSFRHSYKGKIQAFPPPAQQNVTLYFPTPEEWALFGASQALAFATPSADSQGNLLEGNVLFNPDNRWGIASIQPGEYDFTAVAVHEIGHVLGLAHSEFSGAIMYYSSQAGAEWTTRFQSKLSNDDEQAICTLYPRLDCQAPTDCGSCFACQADGKCQLLSIPETSAHCKPCQTDTDCKGTSGERCVRLSQGFRCLQACDKAGCCPGGYRCSEALSGFQACVPLEDCPLAPCTTNDQCGPGEDCIASKCRSPAVTLDGDVCKPCSINERCTGTTTCLELSSQGERCLQRCIAGNFCPQGYVCRTSPEGSWCYPEDQICTCRRDTDCTGGLKCIGSYCQKAGGGTFGDPCTARQPCATDHQCFPTQDGGRCYQPCGTPQAPACLTGFSCKDPSTSQDCAGQATCLCFPLPGIQAPGEACRPGLGCRPGATCLGPGGTGFCYEECTGGKPCSQGGTCSIGVNGLSFCGCTETSQCPLGRVCQQPAGAALSLCTSAGSGPCGDSKCDASANETCASCPADCRCPEGQTCLASTAACVRPLRCGDGFCDETQGETCSSCLRDCACAIGSFCKNSVCQAPAEEPKPETSPDAAPSENACAPSLPESCSPDDKACLSPCKPPPGCACSSFGGFDDLTSLLLLFFGLAYLRLRSRRPSPVEPTCIF